MNVFVDTNVFVYARDSSEPAKQPVAAAWVDRLWETGQGRTGVQVLNELYVTLTAKLDPGLPDADARADVRDLVAWRPTPLTTGLVEQAWDLQDSFSLSHWDALVVAAAREAGTRHLLTEDLEDGLEIDDLLVVNPFVHNVDDVVPPA